MVPIAISVAISIAVAVSVTVAVSVMAGMCAVENHCKVFQTFGLVYLFELVEHFAVEESGTDNKERAVAMFLDDLSVGNDVDRWAVDEYVVIFLTHLIDECLEPIAVQ